MQASQTRHATMLCSIILAATATAALGAEKPHSHAHIHFDLKSVANGNWSNPKTWQPARVPAKGDRVIVSRSTRVVYDRKSKDVIRFVQIVGTLSFARDRDTELNVGVLKVQNSDECSESGFACDFQGVNRTGEPQDPRGGDLPTLEVGSLMEPIPAKHTARIRLHYIEGMNKDDAPALVCCSARMELHGAPMNRTWVELGGDVKPGDSSIGSTSELIQGDENGYEN